LNQTTKLPRREFPLFLQHALSHISALWFNFVCRPQILAPDPKNVMDFVI